MTSTLRAMGALPTAVSAVYAGVPVDSRTSFAFSAACFASFLSSLSSSSTCSSFSRSVLLTAFPMSERASFAVSFALSVRSEAIC